MLGKSSKLNDVAVSVALHCTRCFSVAAQFAACRATFVSIPQLAHDLVRILRYRTVSTRKIGPANCRGDIYQRSLSWSQNLPKLCCHVVECVISFSEDATLQQRLIDEGAMWYLLTFLFKYDYTLEECGVERTEEANAQVRHRKKKNVANRWRVNLINGVVGIAE